MPFGMAKRLSEYCQENSFMDSMNTKMMHFYYKYIRITLKNISNEGNTMGILKDSKLLLVSLLIILLSEAIGKLKSV